MPKDDQADQPTSTRPNFIYVGAPKSGSTWVFEALRNHPEMYVFPGKSTEYFESETQAPLEDYLAFFKNADGARCIGEVSHDTYLMKDSARAIADRFPDMKIVICLREPGDFAKSAIRWWSTHTANFGETAKEMSRHQRFIALMDHFSRVQPFYDAFPRDQIHVAFFEELKTNPEEFLSALYRFLGVDVSYRPEVLEKVVNPSLKPRSKHVTHFAFAVGGILRKLGLGPFVEHVKHMPSVEKVLYAKGYDELDSEVTDVVSQVRQDSAPMLDKLETLIERPLPKYWRAQ